MIVSYSPILANVVDTINNSNSYVFDGTNYANVMRKPEIESWKPIAYSSMKWFMFWNYVLLVCMIALPSLVIYGLVTL